MEPDDYQDEIREFALRFSADIQRDPDAFRPFAEELLAIPKAKLRDIFRGKGQKRSPFSERSRRLYAGWERAEAPFQARTIGRHWNFAMFTLQDARRIALLTALTFDAEFDGAALGLGWPLDGDEARFDGRCWTWVAVESFQERREIVREAARLLDRAEEESNRLPPLPPLTEQQQRFRDLLLERPSEDLITSDALCELYGRRSGEAVESSNFRGRVYPELREWGLKSYGKKGYAFPEDCPARRWARKQENRHR